MGFARRCLERFPEILKTVSGVIAGCGCEDGCPSCVGSAVPPFATTDLDSVVRGRFPDKAAARALLDLIGEAPEACRLYARERHTELEFEKE
jgi:ATP-dependent helicase YprA (DUF1998 family)